MSYELSAMSKELKRMDIRTYLKERRELIDSFLTTYFACPVIPTSLNESMAYSIFAGGKRVRPVLALASYEACGGHAEDIVPYASALEFIHTYSLIHDDLPAMDNDNLRRGKPTSHKVFGEGMAILAGDALLTEAFYLLSRNAHHSSGVRDRDLLKVVREVAMAAGAHGMVGGQAEDILSEGMEKDGENLSFIHAHKTGALITVSVRMGAILGRAGKRKLSALTIYGENIGLAFQIVDDILDVKGDSAELGKATGSDEKKRKLTYPGLYGIDLSVKKAEGLIRDAVNALSLFSDSADPLREIAGYILQRKN
jgi:geranylgeranyl diphosphate synthase type II